VTDEDLEQLMLDLESDRVERKTSISDVGRICEAICAFANDLPDHRKPGVVFIGLNDDATCVNLPITDELLRTLAGWRSDGNILPLPSMSVQKRTVGNCETAVVIVEPSDAPPVRYKGRVWIRVGPTRAIATQQDEHRLAEKRRSRDLPFDLHVISTASLDDLDLEFFEREYLPAAFSPDIFQKNEREATQQLASLRFATVHPPHHPTVLGLLALGKSPADYVPGAYVQFLRIDGNQLADPISDQHELHGRLVDLLRRMDDVLRSNIRTATDIRSGATELRAPDYPLVALQQLTRNAVMHRDYQLSNAPVRITWFNDRVEVQNPGGPYGQVTAQNFAQPGITDYRNPHLAEAMKTLGFVQRFGVGIPTAQDALAHNGNPPAEFRVESQHVLVTIKDRP